MISHDLKTVFVHVPKTAGQSVELAFLRELDLEWACRAPLLLLENSQPRAGPPRLAHLTARDYVDFHYLTQDLYEEYFTFAFVRNPWDRMVSLYKYYRGPLRGDFKTFLFKCFERDLWETEYWFVRPQVEYLTSATGELLVDFVGRFERLEDDFRRVAERVGMSDTFLPRRNKSKVPLISRTNMIGGILVSPLNAWRSYQWERHTCDGDFRKYYDAESQEVVGRLYADDVDRFDYSFEQGPGRTIK